jgi:hypothetical protein
VLTPPGVKDRVRNYTRERRIDRLTCVESMYIHKRYPCVYNSRRVDRQSTEWNTPSLQSVKPLPMPNNAGPTCQPQDTHPRLLFCAYRTRSTDQLALDGDHGTSTTVCGVIHGGGVDVVNVGLSVELGARCWAKSVPCGRRAVTCENDTSLWGQEGSSLRIHPSPWRREDLP